MSSRRDSIDVDQEIDRLADLPDHLYREAVGNYLRHSSDAKRRIFRSEELLPRTSIALDQLKHMTAERIKHARDSRRRGNMAAFGGLIQAEIRAITPMMRQHAMLTSRSSDVYRALLALADKYQGPFQELLAEERRRRKRRGREHRPAGARSQS